MSFAQNARQLFALAAQTLGWRPDEFWRATPCELADALRDPAMIGTPGPPDKSLILSLMERDAHER